MKAQAKYITSPGWVLKEIRQTPTQIVAEITDVWCPVHTTLSGGTYQVDTDRADYVRGVVVGQKRRFWKATGCEVGGDHRLVEWP